MTYAGIEFSYSDMLDDIDRMVFLAEAFLSTDSLDALKSCGSLLESIRNSRTGRRHFWEIGESWPLVTIESEGAYRSGGEGSGITVFGQLCFRWEIENPDAGRKRQQNFHLVGEATTSLKIFQFDDSQLVAQWQVEAGDASSPGCHFHSGINQYGSSGLFPEWLKVPRLPGLLVTPMDALEFLLGELFQDRWPQNVSKESDFRNAWAKGQRGRFERILAWKLKSVREATSTPWMALKKQKPELGILRD